MAFTRRKLVGLLGSGASGALVTGALVACGVGSQAGTEKPLDKKVVANVRYLTWWPLDRAGTIDTWKAGLKEDFPNINVEAEIIALGDYNTKFQVALSSGTAPDVVLQNSHAQTRW